MIAMIIAILLSLSTGTACEMGQEVDWYQWAEENEGTAHVIMRLETDDAGDAWVYRQDDGDYLLFVFREDVSDTLASGRSDPHGQCARLISAK